MSKVLIPIIFLTFLVGQDNYKSIHQIELDFNKENYLEPLFKPYFGPANPIQPKKIKSSKKVFGYHPYWQGTKWQSYNYELLTTIAYFSVETNANGDLTNLHGWPATDLINKAHSHGVEVVLTVTLFDKSEIETLLSTKNYRDRLINNLNKQVIDAGADGINIDFESFPSSQKENLVTFVKDLRSTLRNSISNAKVTLATPAVDWENAWDFNALAIESDGLFIMGYDYHWKESTNAGPVSPLIGGTYNVTNTLNTYLSTTNNNYEKLILGIPYYGYNWPTSSDEKGAKTTNSGTAAYFSEAETKALSYGKIWYSSSETPWFKYQNPIWNQTWYDDSLSISKKYDLALSKNLGGIGIWALGYDEGYDELWNLLKDKIAAKMPPATPVNFNIINLGNESIMIDFSSSENATSFEVNRVFKQKNESESLGKFTTSPILLQNLSNDEPYFIKIRAENDYGSSKYTELLGVIPSKNSSKVLIVNGFDRVYGTDNTRDFILQHGNAIHKNNYTINNNDYFFHSINFWNRCIIVWNSYPFIIWI